MSRGLTTLCYTLAPPEVGKVKSVQWGGETLVEYILVRWVHDFPNEPIWLVSELDDERWEMRKVEVFPDGTQGYASGHIKHGGTGLGIEPVPLLEDIAGDPQFIPTTITRAEFEAIWNRRNSTFDPKLIPPGVTAAPAS